MSKIVRATATGFGCFAETTVLELNLAPPISEVRGYNGAGKSTLIGLLRRALGDDSAIPTRTLGATDPAEFILESDGHKLSIRLGEKFSPRNAAALAAFPVALATQDTRQLEALVGPDDQSESNSPAARAKRLVALASIARVEMTPANLAHLSSGLEVKLDGWKKDDVASIRLELYSRLTAQEAIYTARADRLSGEVSTHTRALADLPDIAATDPGISIPDATAAETAAIRAHGRTADSYADRLRQITRQEALKDTLSPPAWPDATFTAANWIMETVLNSAPSDADLTALGVHIATIGAGLTATRTALETWRAQRKILDTEATGATEADVTAASVALEQAAFAKLHAEQHALYLDASAKLSAAGEAEQAARASAKAYRQAAQAIPARLADLIRQAGLTDWGVDADGDVTIEVDGAPFPFALRSRSQRVIAAIVLIASQVRPVPGKLMLILVSDVLYTALNDWSRADLEGRLEPYAAYVHVLTEAPTIDGGLRSSHPME